MKSRPYVLVSEYVKKKFLSDLYCMPLDGSVTVTVSSTGSKSTKQRGLQHVWYNDIVMSGLGGKYEANDEILDVYCKYRWGIRILTSEAIGPNENFHLGEAYIEYSRIHKANAEKMMWWTKQNIHTEQMSNNQMAQFLTAIRDYYGHEVGVNLADPDEKGWGNLLEIAEVAA